MLNGAQLQKIIELLKVPGDLALASVKRLIEKESMQHLPNQFSQSSLALAIRDHSPNAVNFQTPAGKRSESKTPHKIINLSLASK